MDGHHPLSGLGHVLLVDASIWSPSCELSGSAHYDRQTTQRRLDIQLNDTKFSLLKEDIENFYPNDVYDIPVEENAEIGTQKMGTMKHMSGQRPITSNHTITY
jgi:hypothetical protein